MKHPNLYPALLLSGLLAAAPVSALDDDHGEGPPPAAHRVTPPTAVTLPPAPPPGERTYRLLEQQRSGQFASRHDQWLSGDVQQQIYHRYVDSFSRPIPETFIEHDFSD